MLVKCGQLAITGDGTFHLFKATDPEEVSHMLFGSGSKLSGMFATHPPLTERIQALDPNFNERDYPRVVIDYVLRLN